MPRCCRLVISGDGEHLLCLRIVQIELERGRSSGGNLGAQRDDCSARLQMRMHSVGQ